MRHLIVAILLYTTFSILHTNAVYAQTPPYDFTGLRQIIANFTQHTIFDFNAMIWNILNPPPPTPTLTPIPPPPTITLTPVPSGQYTFIDGYGGDVFTAEDNMLLSPAVGTGADNANLAMNIRVDSILLNRYNYKNLLVRGALDEKKFTAI